MEFEDSTGKFSVPKNVQEIEDMVDRLGRGIDHCILSDGDMFVQAAGADPRIVVEYGDSTGHYEAAEPLSARTVKDIMSAFFRKDVSWKTMAAFSPTGDFAAGPATGTADSDGGAGATREKSLKDSLLDSVKREVKNNASRMVGRGVRDIFRKFR